MAPLFGRRLRRGATTTAVAAVAIAALSASQAPGLTPGPGGSGNGKNAGDAQGSTPDTATGNSRYYTELPPLDSPTPSTGSSGLPDPGTAVGGSSESGIPATVLAAYRKAEQALRETNPQCRLPWQLLAAIGKVESNQARNGEVDTGGTTLHPILGPVLDGNGFANIPDTDHGVYDQDTVHDRAVGPMQFIPSTWRTWGRDANHDGVKDPNNIYDAALAAGAKLCAGDHDMTVQADMNAAILSYNKSQEYLNTVLSWYEYYRKGTYEIPDGTDTPPTPTTSPTGPFTGLPSPGPSATLTRTPRPGHSATPSGGTGPKPGKPTPSGGSSTPPVTPKPVLKSLVKVSKDTLSAMAGTKFGGRFEVRAVDGTGKPMAKIAVTFKISGSTDAHFDGGGTKTTGTTTTVTTGKDGTAEAPAVRAGEDVGSFTVRATAGGVPAADFTATVTPHSKLVYVGDEQSAEASAAFVKPIVVKATLGGAAEAKLAVSAAILTDKGASVPDNGPSFKTADGKLVKTLSGLTTAADGTLTLPTLVAGKDTGSYLVKLTAADGGSVTVTVKVAAPADTSSGDTSGDPTGDPSGVPSTSPSSSPSTSPSSASPSPSSSPSA